MSYVVTLILQGFGLAVPDLVGLGGGCQFTLYPGTESLV